MGKETGISWTNHTFNPWHGCVKVSAACDNCYAERTDKRFGEPHWGKDAPRKFMRDKYWAQPLEWNAEALEAGVPRRVFCASMADVVEERADVSPHRLRMWQLIRDTPQLDWLLLSKRPENFERILPWAPVSNGLDWGMPWPNVGLGVTAENEAMVAERVVTLRRTPAAIRFVSCEAILEPIRADVWNIAIGPNEGLGTVHWLILGDESGPVARPAQVVWLRTAREAAQRHGVAFH